MTDEAGNVVAVIELDPWGGETDRSVNQRPQPYRYTSYERDGDGVDQALMRSYHGWWTRFNEPDPWEGSYDLTDPQSFNRYAYVQNDPVNYVDPAGLMMEGGVSCYIDGVESDCGLALRIVEAGAAVIGPEQTTRWNPNANGGRGAWEFFVAYADGRGGWLRRQLTSVSFSSPDYPERGVTTRYTWYFDTLTSGKLVGINGQWYIDTGSTIRDLRGRIVGERGLDAPAIDPVELGAGLFAGGAVWGLRGAIASTTKEGAESAYKKVRRKPTALGVG